MRPRLLASTLPLPLLLVGCESCPTLRAGRVHATAGPGTTRTKHLAGDELAAGTAFDRALRSGESHTYRLRLAAGQYAEVTTEQRGIDVVTEILSPEHTILVVCDSPTANRGREHCSLVARTSGTYLIKLRALYKRLSAGRYRITLRVLRQATESDQLRDRARRLDVVGTRLLQRQDAAEALRRAVEVFEEQRVLMRAASDPVGEAEALGKLASCHQLLGQPLEAVRHRRQALTLLQTSGVRGPQVQLLHDIGAAYAFLGELDTARVYFQRALEGARNAAHPRWQARALTGLAALHAYAGEHEAAHTAFGEALALWEDLGHLPGQIEALAGLGAATNALGRQRESRRLLDRALPLLDAVEHYRWDITALTRVASLCALASSDAAAALAECYRALQRAISRADPVGEAQALAALGAAFERSGSNAAAAGYYARAASSWHGVGDHPREAEALLALAHLERERGDLVRARETIEKSLARLEAVRAGVTSSELRATFAASKRGYYDAHIDLLMLLHRDAPTGGYDAAALQASESARARRVVESLLESNVDLRRGVDPALLDAEQRLRAELRAFEERELARLRGADRATAFAGREPGDLLARLQEVQARIVAQSPAAPALAPRALTLAEIQRTVLDADSVLLEYALGQERSYLWVVTPTALASFELVGREPIEQAARLTYDLLIARTATLPFETPEEKRQRVRRADAEYLVTAARLTRMILEPAAALLGNRRLLVVSDGALHYIPFAALPAPLRARGDTGSSPWGHSGRRLGFVPLVARHEIVHLPSASALHALRQRRPRRRASKTLAVIADPVFAADDARVGRRTRREAQLDASSLHRSPGGLARRRGVPIIHTRVRDLPHAPSDLARAGLGRLPGSRREANAITRLLEGDEVLEALDFAASRSTVTSGVLCDYRVVHFATHALLNSRYPRLSGLVLSLVNRRGEPEHGYLPLYALDELELGADLVVLSACGTALGKELSGEGLVGLAHGFMYAGTPTVIASLWSPLDRPTAELMLRFYRSMLQEGLPAAAALRAAQLSMWRDDVWSAPYHWAAFVLQGEWNVESPIAATPR